ncbi:MAG: SAM-dependent chlorinase/fluorinase [Thermoleophilaceae bacterium]|nr:SAM-dependent chlorinase/fluorinase [Thermoleophilaceae bacterium]
MIVTLLTDYGHDDDFAGVCRGVIKRIAPDADLIDITHGIPRHAVRQGALALAEALPYMPVGVHMAVVDPQVGTERRAVAVRTGDERILVGPDNGLLSLAWEALGGAIEASDVSRSPHRLEPVSATFHGRDLFAPVTAHIAAGASISEAGEPLDPDNLVRIEVPEPVIEQGRVVAHVLGLDRYGNASLNVAHDQLAGTGLTFGASVVIERASGRRDTAVFASTFADVPDGALLVYEDAYRRLAIAVNRGNAESELDLREDDELVLRPA